MRFVKRRWIGSCVPIDVAECQSDCASTNGYTAAPCSRVSDDGGKRECDCARPDKDSAASDIASSALICVASRDVEPDHLHDARRARVDVQHTARTRGTRLCVQHDRACHRRLEDDAPGDAELGAEVVGAGGKDDAADGGVGECTGQAGGGAHRRGPRRIRRRRWRRRQARRRGRRQRWRGCRAS